MRSRLEVLLKGIEPVPDQVQRVVDQAFNSFSAPAAVITHLDQYKRLLAEFHAHVESGILGVGGPPVRGPMDSSRCLTLLKKKYGDSAYQTTFDIVRTGNEGGLLAVLRIVTDLLSREHSDNRIGMAVSCYWNNHPPRDLLADCAEYIRNYGHLLPSELTEGSAGRVYANFPKVLREHPYMMQKLRRVGR